MMRNVVIALGLACLLAPGAASAGVVTLTLSGTLQGTPFVSSPNGINYAAGYGLAMPASWSFEVTIDNANSSPHPSQYIYTVRHYRLALDGKPVLESADGWSGSGLYYNPVNGNLQVAIEDFADLTAQPGLERFAFGVNFSDNADLSADASTWSAAQYDIAGFLIGHPTLPDVATYNNRSGTANGFPIFSPITAQTTSGFFFVPVPEPATWALLLVGFGATGAALRSRRKAPA